MKVYTPEEIRNVAVVGHGGTGKTSLVSALLYAGGAVNRLGKVEEGNTVTDHDPEEIERQISMQLSPCFVEHKGRKLNVLDTPGYSAFLFDARLALQAVESAVIVVCGVGGVEVGTEKTWKWAGARGLARFIAVNRLDRERGDFDRCMTEIQERLGREAVAVQIPIGKEHDFRGVVDLVKQKALLFEKDGDGKPKVEDIPADMQDAAESARASLIEMVAETDDALLEKYLEEGELSDEEFLGGLRGAVKDGKLFPVFAVSASHNMGSLPILQALADLAPSPADAGEIRCGKPEGEGEVVRSADPNGPYAAYVFKTFVDPFSGRVTTFRVLSGTIKADQGHWNASRETEERFGPLFLLQGKEHVKVDELQAGDIGAVAKLRETQTNDTLADKDDPAIFPVLPAPEPAISFAIQPKAKGDEEKISAALVKITDEDITLKVDRDLVTHEMVVGGSGQLHIEAVVGKLKRRYGVEVDLKAPKVPYRETVTKTGSAQYRHKKQTGGAGQFAEVHLRVEPKGRGEGFEYASEVFGGAISQNFIPSIQKGIKQVMTQGILAGYPVSDLKAIVFDGKEHPVDSKDIAFQIAGREVFKKAFLDAKPTILEPIMNVQVIVPEANMGDIVGDLTSRRGRVQGMDSAGGGMQEVNAQVPLAEMLNYVPTLNSITGGRGDYHMELSHYEETPAHIQQKIIEEAQKAKEEEKAEG